MKFLRPGFIALAMVAYAGSANATFFYYFGADTPTDGTANTSVSSATAEANWEAKVATLYPTLSIATFETNFNNVSTATGINANGGTPNFSASDSNVNLSNPDNVFKATADGYTTGDTGINPSNYGIATFNGLAGAGTPGFTINATETADVNGDGFAGQRRSGVFFNDEPAGKTDETKAGWENVLSIGKFNGFEGVNDPETNPNADFDNDNFELEITGGNQLYAFAFNIINNKDPGSNGEKLEVFSSSGDAIELTTIGGFDHDNTTVSGTADSSTTIPGYIGGDGTIGGVQFVHTSFIGIVTDDLSEVFSFLKFFEDTGANDIGIFNLQFAVVPVPVPATVWLFGSGLIALFGLRRRRK